VTHAEGSALAYPARSGTGKRPQGASCAEHGDGVCGEGWPTDDQPCRRGEPATCTGSRETVPNYRQVHELAGACGDDYRPMVLFLAYTGLRSGEMAALTVGRVDFLRRPALVAESVTPVEGVLTFGPTKGHERREVPIPRFLIDDLARHVEGKSSDDLVFTGERGAVMRSGTFRRGALIEAAKAIGIPGFHPHELRHTAASLAIASGADVKVVQQMLGPSRQP
jgi:integrase